MSETQRLTQFKNKGRDANVSSASSRAYCQTLQVCDVLELIAGAPTPESGGERRAPEGEERWSDVQEEKCGRSSWGRHFPSSGKDSELPGKSFKIKTKII